MNKKILGAAVLAVLAYLGYQMFSGSTGTGDVAEKEAGSPIATVTVPELDYNAKLGETAFNNNCAACHGENAAGQEGVAPPLVHRIYEPNHHGDAAFIIAVKNGVRAHHWRWGNMPALPDISEIEVRKIIEYVRALQRANGIN